MVYLAQLNRAALYFLLSRIDRSLAAQVRASGCPRCGARSTRPTTSASPAAARRCRSR